MRFKLWLENVLAHVSGASGSGKTTLANNLQPKYPNIIFKDLDEFDDEAVKILNFSEIKKNDYSDKMLEDLAKLRQKLMDDFIKKSKKPIVFVGHHTEGEHVLNIQTKNKFMLNVDAKTSALRAFKRSQKEDIKSRRKMEELPGDEQEAQEVIDFLKKNGYKVFSAKEIEDWIKRKI